MTKRSRSGEATRFRIVTYNVHKCRGMDGRVMPSRIVEVLAQVDADIVALQEVFSGSNVSRQADQARFIAEELGLEYRVGRNKTTRRGVFGNVLLTRFPILHTRNHDVSCEGRECRGCLRMDVQLTPETVLHVFNAHLGTSLRERQKQAHFLLSTEILGHEEMLGPRVLVGDFNDWELRLARRLSPSRLISADIRAHWDRRGSYPSFFPLLHLDHVYYDSQLHLEYVRRVRSRSARIASDHLPIVADFRVLSDTKTRTP
jgi:endonuclease/exonuclease/phosphatase family metal-dependent hydrolase